MDDLISRRAAIKAIDDLQNCYNGYSDTYDKAYIIGVLEELPTIEPKKVVEDYCIPRNLMVIAAEDFHRLAEQKRGKWIYKTQNVKGGKGQTYGKWQCSCCKKKEPRRRDYCPNCGARMEKSE